MSEQDLELNDSLTVPSEEDANTEVSQETDIDADAPSDKAEDDIEALKEANRRLFARAKKAEGFVLKDGKWVKKDSAPEEKPKPKSINRQSGIDEQSVDEKILRATKGYDDEAIEQLKAIARGKDTSLLGAEQDDLFKLYLNSAEVQKKREAAQIGASKGSGTVVEKSVDFNDPNLSPEEHRKLVEKFIRGK